MDFNDRNQQYTEQNDQRYNNAYYQNPQQQQFYNNTYQEPMMDGKFHRPDFNNQPYNKRDFYMETMRTKNRNTVIDTKTAKGKLEVFALLWCFVSVILAIILADKEGLKGVAVALMGQSFVGVGIMMFVKQKHKFESMGVLLVPVLGIGLFIVGLIMTFGNQAVNAKLAEIGPYVGFGFFFILGLFLIIFPSIVKKKKEERCTVPVRAVVIDHLRNHGSKNRTYTPLFEYTYKSVKYREQDNIYTKRSSLPQVGQEMTMYINEEDPTDFYVEWKGKRSNQVIGGICFMAISVAMTALFLAAS